MSRPGSPGPARRFPKAFAYLLCLVPALAVALGQPVWSRVDEAQHADFVAQIAHGSYPIEGRTPIRQATLDLMAATGVFRWNVPGQEPVPVLRDIRGFQTVPPYLTGYARRLWIGRHLWTFSYEAVQPPLYYLAAAPFWLAGERVAGPLGGVYAVRVFSALLLASLGPLTLALAGLVLPGRRAAAWLAVAMVALTPGLVLNGTQVSNDPAAAALGAAALLAALRGRQAGWTLRLAVLTGILLGAAAAAKLTAAGLALPVAAAFLWPAETALHLRLARGAVAAVAAALVVAPWLALNLHLYGHLLPSQAGHDLLGAVFPPRFDLGFLLESARNAFATFWAGEPYREVPLHQLTTYLMAAWLAVAAAGVWRLRHSCPLLGFAVLAGVAEVAWAFGTLSFAGVGGLTPGRYLYPCAAAVCALLAVGFLEVVHWQPARVAAIGLFAAGAAVNVSGFLLGFTGMPQQRPGMPAAGLPSYAVAARADYAGVTVAADRLVADAPQQCIWIHIQAVNGSGGPVDWWPVLYVRGIAGVYGDSSPFPDTLATGQQVAGWVKVPVPPSALAWPVKAQMVDIAANGYRDLGGLTLVLVRT